MMTKQILTVSITSLLLAGCSHRTAKPPEAPPERTPSATTSVYTQNFNMVSGGGFTMVQSGGMTVIVSSQTHSSDDISGGWSRGMNSSLERVLNQGALPAKYVFPSHHDLNLRLSNNERAWILALDQTEGKVDSTEARNLIQSRADATCRLTGIYPHAIKHTINWSSGRYLYIDPTKITTGPNGNQYEAIQGNHANTVAYFDSLECGFSPANFRLTR